MPDITKAPPEKALNREGPFAYSHSPNKQTKKAESHVFCVVGIKYRWGGGKAQAGLRGVVFAARLTVRETHRVPVRAIERAV